jgi:hypothetical protein
LKAEVKEIQSTGTKAAQKDEKVDEGFILFRFRNIARMAPDILDLVAAMLANPLAGQAWRPIKSLRRRRKILNSDSHLAPPFKWEGSKK